MSLTLEQALIGAEQRLRLAGVPDAEVDAQWLLCAVCDMGRNALRFQKDLLLTETQEQALECMLTRREKREPLQHILGTQPFLELLLKTDARALIPRDETQLLVELAIKLCRENGSKSALDIGTGAGAIALALKHACPALAVCAVDISPQALALATENARALQLDIELLQSNLYSALKGRRFDIIISNPPYIPTRDITALEPEVADFEPLSALDGGVDGMHFYASIIKDAKEHLNRNGIIAFEAGIHQAEAIAELLMKQGFRAPVIGKDYSGIDRMVWAKID